MREGRVDHLNSMWFFTSRKLTPCIVRVSAERVGKGEVGAWGHLQGAVHMAAA